MRNLLQSLLFRSPSAARGRIIARIKARRQELRRESDGELKVIAQRAVTLEETLAIAAVVAERLLGLEMFDVQIRGSLALADGRIAEMQTGEGKTLAAVPAVIWYAKAGNGVHVMTVNDYLARRDAKWMGPVYDFLASLSDASSRA